MQRTHHQQLVFEKLDRLRPTQMTVGYREVAEKRAEWKKLGKKARQDTLDSHWFPCVLGPDGEHYVVDHHHLGLALIEERAKQVRLLILKDLSWLAQHTFWQVMEYHQWVHPFDADGVRHGFDKIPRRLTDLQNDPYRSLAGDLRRVGGYAKDTMPFSEFLWAEFLRERISRARLDKDFPKALRAARKLASSPDARYLPGWAGEIETVETF